MIDATGMPQTAVVLGGNSDLGLELVRQLAQRRLRSVVLGGRDQLALQDACEELKILGVQSEARPFDIRDTDHHEAFAQEARSALGTIDLLIVATGLLGSSDLDEIDSETVANSLQTNLTGPGAAIIAFVQIMRKQGFGRIIVFSSAGGVRVRRTNFVYGGAKAGLDGFCQGLGDSLVGTGVHVMIVRPGFVPTKMTEGRKPSSPLPASIDQVATAVVRGLEMNKSLVWIPSVLAAIFPILVHLPRRLWRMLPNRTFSISRASAAT